MTVEEAITTSIEYENKVRDVYVDAAERAEHPDGKRLFQLMAEEEQHHVDYLTHKLDEWSKTGAVTSEGLKTSLPSPERIEESKAKLEGTVGDAAGTIELQFLQKALAVEQETGGFYKRVVAELPGEAKTLFKRFLEIEEGHLAIVQAQIDLAQGTGYWFDVREFDLMQ